MRLRQRLQTANFTRRHVNQERVGASAFGGKVLCSGV
jgi:hypothetical protein